MLRPVTGGQVGVGNSGTGIGGVDKLYDNVVMQNAVARLGFKRSGIIHLANGSPRIAYELAVRK